jgi:hypothetical protein
VITTDSSTRCWNDAPRPALSLRRAFEAAIVVVLAALMLAGAPTARAEPPAAEVTQLRLERSDDDILLSATVRFEMPPVVEDALEKGIPMFFVAEAALFRDRWYWYDKQITYSARHMRLSYQPLTRRWRLIVSSTPIGNSGGGLGQTFDTRDEALAAVQRISRWKIADASEIDLEVRHNVDFRFRLDVSQLPRPFQIGAVGHADWSISAARNQRLALESLR